MAHSLIDVFSVFNADHAGWIRLIAIMIIAIAYSIYLTHVETPAINLIEKENF